MFSIIIPIYNVKEYLQQCMDSLKNQAEKYHAEIFLVDDGSTDGSGEIAKKYSELYPTVFQYLIKENGGLSDARNYAIPLATKEYLIFIDSDDYVQDNMLDEMVNVIKKENPDLIIFDYIKKWNNKEEKIDILKCSSGLISNQEYLLSNPAAWNKVIRTRIIRENQIVFPKGLWYEDRATTGNYVNFCNKIYYLNYPCYYYRQRENSIMQQKQYNEKMMDIIIAMEMFDKQVSNLYGQEKEYLFISNLLFQSALRLIPLGKYEQMTKCINLLKKKYPNWEKNQYFVRQTKKYKILCYLLSMKMYTISKIIINARIKGA